MSPSPPPFSLSAPVPATLSPPSARDLVLTIVSVRREYAAAVRGRGGASSPAADAAWRALERALRALLARTGTQLAPPGASLADVRAALAAAEAGRRGRRRAAGVGAAVVAFLMGRAVGRAGTRA